MTTAKQPTARALRAAKVLEACGWSLDPDTKCNVCHPCGTAHDLSAKYCQQCGQPLTMCGGPLEELEAAIAAANEEVQP